MVVVFCQARQAPVLMTAKYNYSNNSFNLKCQLKWTSLVHQQTLVKLPQKQTASTIHVTWVLLGSWTRLSFPHNQRHTSLEAFFLSDPVRRWCTGDAGEMPIYGLPPFNLTGSARIERNPEWSFLHRYIYRNLFSFFFTLAMLSMRIKLFNS